LGYPARQNNDIDQKRRPKISNRPARNSSIFCAEGEIPKKKKLLNNITAMLMRNGIFTIFLSELISPAHSHAAIRITTATKSEKKKEGN